jgi:hypothetical protein
MIECPQCEAGEICFLCGSTGYVTPEEILAFEEAEEAAMMEYYNGSDSIEFLSTSNRKPLEDSEIPF